MNARNGDPVQTQEQNSMQTRKSRAISWDSSLIDRYDLAGPRYTSYPTALQFKDDFGFDDIHSAIQRSNVSGRPLSLYFHLPFCDTLCYYCGCNKVVTHNKQRAAPYLKRLDMEMMMQARLFDVSRTITQLHWGGGTPTFISDEEMSWLMSATKKHFNLLSDDSGEYSIEIHPGRVKASTMAHLRKLGFNRVSMGVQDFDPRVQQAVNRYNSVEEVSELVTSLREQNYHSISMDLIYGLPLQTLTSVADTLDKVIEMSPDRLSIFNYAHMPHLFKSQQLIKESDLPTTNEKLEILRMSIEHLEKAGYVYIGMDHFAKPSDSLVKAQNQGKLQRNFQGYSTHGDCDLLSFGVSSISAYGDTYIQNAKQLHQYQQSIDRGDPPAVRGFHLNEDDRLRKTIINQIICHFDLNISTIEMLFNIDFFNYFTAEYTELQQMQQDGLLNLNRHRLQITDKGRLLVRRICMVFDAYLRTNNLIQYSKII